MQLLVLGGNGLEGVSMLQCVQIDVLAFQSVCGEGVPVSGEGLSEEFVRA